MRNPILSAGIAALVAGCAATTPAPAPRPEPPESENQVEYVIAERDRGMLAYFLEGTWDTIQQQGTQYGDSTPRRLRIARIWPEREGEVWLYWEIVDPRDEQKALRQRIVKLAREGLKLYGYDYRVPGNPAGSVGEWRKDKPFAGISPESLKAYPGCRTFWMKQVEVAFAAGTDGQDCRGDGPPGLHEHTEFYLGSTSMRAWFQLLDASGHQVEGLPLPSEFRKFAQKPR